MCVYDPIINLLFFPCHILAYTKFYNTTKDLKRVIPHTKECNPQRHTNFLLLWDPPRDPERSLTTTKEPKEMKSCVNGRKFK